MKTFFSFLQPIRSLKIRYKVGLVFFLPVTLALALFIVMHYLSERQSIRDLAESSAVGFGQVTLSSLKHAMLMNDTGMITGIVNDAVDQSSIQQVRIVDMNGFVWQSSTADEVGQKNPFFETGCVECHRLPADERPQAINISSDPGLMQIAMPIPNEPECAECHDASDIHLGMLIVDTPITDAQMQLSFFTLLEFLISLTVIIIFMVFDFILIQRIIVHPLEVIHSALLKLGSGDFSTRISQRRGTDDEITQLAEHFNQIAANIERMQARQEERDRVRAQAIVEERERIARELHDGVAQFLGYLSAKVAAIRLALQNKNTGLADQHLGQVEESIRNQSSEVRSAIIGLKISSNINQDLISSAHEFVDQCNRLGGLHLEIEIIGNVDAIHLNEETALQLFRILQEAVSNVRKHSQSTEASIRFERRADTLVMTIQDNGVGFDPLLIRLEQKGHFGIQIMVERAQQIGAQIEIKSSPRQGTQVIVTVENQES